MSEPSGEKTGLLAKLLLDSCVSCTWWLPSGLELKMLSPLMMSSVPCATAGGPLVVGTLPGWRLPAPHAASSSAAPTAALRIRTARSMAQFWGGSAASVLALDQRSGLHGSLEELEGVAQDAALQLGVVGRAEGVAKLEIGPHDARGPGLQAGFRREADHDGGQACHLDFPLNRDDRAVTEARSAGGEQHDIGAGLVQRLGDFGRDAVVDGPQVLRVAEAVVLVVHPGDEAFGRQLAGSLQREHDVRVAVGVRVVVVLVSDPQIAHARLAGDDPVGGVAREVEGLLGAEIYAGHRN